MSIDCLYFVFDMFHDCLFCCVFGRAEGLFVEGSRGAAAPPSENCKVLLNLYRDGKDSNGWHSDDEKELGTHPFIASLSFGAKRIFHFKHKTDASLKFKIELEPGSLLLMGGATQAFWKHQIPKTKRKIAPRINLTFRNIKDSFF